MGGGAGECSYLFYFRIIIVEWSINTVVVRVLAYMDVPYKAV